MFAQLSAHLFLIRMDQHTAHWLLLTKRKGQMLQLKNEGQLYEDQLECMFCIEWIVTLVVLCFNKIL